MANLSSVQKDFIQRYMTLHQGKWFSQILRKESRTLFSLVRRNIIEQRSEKEAGVSDSETLLVFRIAGWYIAQNNLKPIPPKFEIGDEVQWKWGNKSGIAIIKEIHLDRYCYFYRIVSNDTNIVMPEAWLSPVQEETHEG